MPNIKSVINGHNKKDLVSTEPKYRQKMQLYQERKLPVESKLPGPECSIRSHNRLRLAQLPREKVHWTVRSYFQKTVCKPQVLIQP